MNSQATTLNSETGPGLMSLAKWAKAIGLNRITAYRFRKRGWLQTVNICGRAYVTLEGAAEFKRRAEAGEFAQEHKSPFKIQGMEAA